MAPDTAKNRRRHSCYFLNREYEYGVLYDFLKDLRPGLLIVGLDFGAAETQAYKCSLSQTGATVFEKLKLSSNSNTIPTFICYRDGQAFIGPAARNDPNLIENFKVPPKYWDEPCSTSRNYGQVVGDYIAELWKNARRFDELLSSAAEGGDVLLVVGCPASPDWTGTEEMRRFAELVRAATGCANVAILPESNAAMMNAACSDAGRLRRRAGPAPGHNGRHTHLRRRLLHPRRHLRPHGQADAHHEPRNRRARPGHGHTPARAAG